MPGRDFLFGFKFLATDYVSPVLKGIESRIESVNAAVKNTARFREGGENLIKMGAGALAMGAGIGLVVKSFVGAASEMQTHMAALAATTGLGSTALATLKEHAEAFSESHFAASAVQYVDVYGRLYQNLHNVALAQTAADNAVKAAGATGADYLQIVDLMNVAHENLHVSSAVVAEGLAATVRQFSIGREQVGQMTLGIAKLSPALKAMGGNFYDALAISGQAEQLMGGGRGVQMISRLFETLPEIASKAHLSLNQGLFGVLDQIRARTAGYGAAQQINVLAGMKIDRTMAPEIMRLLGSLDKMRAASAAIKAGGAQLLTSEELSNAQTFQNQTILLGHAWDNLRDTLGAALLPRLTSIVGKMESAVTWVRAFARDDPEITKIAMGFAAVSAAVLTVGGSLAIASGALLGFTSFIPAVKAAAAAFRLGAAATKVWTAAQWLLNGALDANPIALTIIGAAALAVAAYEVYEHWAAVKTFFTSWGSWAYTAGVNLVKAIGSGIAAGIMYPIHAIEAVTTKIMSYMPWHSPSEQGPMRYLNRIRIVETMADTIRPGPALAAIRRTAAAIAIAAPMTNAPAMPALARASGGAGGGTVIQVRQEIHINGAVAGDDQKLLAALRRHGEELADIIDRRLAHRGRREL